MNGREVFRDIAGRYDTLNRVLSLGRDGAWRRSAIDRLPGGRLLDLGAGTGAANRDFGDREVVALDPGLEMLDRNSSVWRVLGFGERLPFADGSFDSVFSAFVFRNLDSVPSALAEIHRVLRPGGAVGIVDLARPTGRTRRAVHRMGTAVLTPLVGLLAGSPREYAYLHRSLDSLPPPEVMLAASPLRVDEVWRMGVFGFVYGALLRK